VKIEKVPVRTGGEEPERRPSTQTKKTAEAGEQLPKDAAREQERGQTTTKGGASQGEKISEESGFTLLNSRRQLTWENLIYQGK